MKIIKAFTSQAKTLLGIKTKEDELDELYGKKRNVFGKAVVRTPWYSLARTRNQIIVSIGVFLYIFSTPISSIGTSISRGNRMKRELTKFSEDLDRLEGHKCDDYYRT